MQIRYLGHSGFAVRLRDARTLLVDPFLTGNPRAAAKPGDFVRVDYVLATHDHDDHLGDSFAICRRTEATFVGVYELAMRAASEGITVEPMSIGGGIDVPGMRINMVNAQHGSGDGHSGGFVIETESKAVYFAGDTALFGDMKLFGELWSLDVAVLPVGDRFTMGPAHAAKAVELLRPKHVIPCHYATFPLLLPDASRFVQLVGQRSSVHPLAPGETFDLV
ncbi:MAG: metal-dependent hydrolase [Candidatus Eiseniibacteriota bacterium]